MKILLLALLALPLVVLADGLPTQPYIYVEGSAEIKKPADLVTLSFTLSFLDADQVEANRLVQKQAAEAFALVKSYKIADADVVAGSLSAQEEHEILDQGYPVRRGKLLGYRVTREFEVVLRDLTRLPKLVNDIIALKPSSFAHIAEGLSTEKQVEDDAWDKAMANARERAEKTLKSTGAKVGKLFAVSPLPFPSITSNLLRGEDFRMNPPQIPQMQTEATEYRLAPVSIAQTVHVIYLIEDAK